MNSADVTSLLLKEFPYEPTKGQRIVLEKIAHFLTESWQKPNSLFILKGYAGTGKTTIVRSLVNVLPKLQRRFSLMAPTGRAAKVLAAYAQKPANTIHRKIYFARTTKEGVIALSLQQNLHKQTLFIVDEASMIQHSSLSDTSLFAARNLLDDLFEYVYSGENCKILFIGDTAQLPPVGLDTSPALDENYLHQAFHLEIGTHELTEVVRQERHSGILLNATFVRNQILREEWALPLFSVSNAHRDVVRVNGTELEDLLNSAYSGAGKENNVVV
jgi:ATP-dependent exoDNAse (exonuclease V) alpha subunit